MLISGFLAQSNCEDKIKRPKKVTKSPGPGRISKANPKIIIGMPTMRTKICQKGFGGVFTGSVYMNTIDVA
jgi:hypothetical protein